MKIALSLLSLTALATAALAAPVTLELPPETATFKAGQGIELAQANCLSCHSPDYLSMQPPMARAFWEAEVKKMIEKYGAPIPAEATASLADYLTATYGLAAAPKP